jgi:2,4-dienoyl-CoA reductase-like NADH-dependent reductase (Old Yellow Enzyme family)
VWIKLGVAGNIESGLTAEEGAAAAGLCAELGVDAIEVSHGLGISEALADNGEGRFMPMAEAVRRQVPPDYPLALVMGFRTRVAMERALEGNVVQAISLCRR